MKIALVHDYIKEYGGAERVLETFHEMYPDAPVFTLVYCPEFLGPHRDRFKNWNIKTSLLQHVPYKHKFISIFRLAAPFLFPLFNLFSYDVIIVSATGAYSPNLVTKGNAAQICYCHTPARYLYGYATARDWKKNPLIRVMAEIMNYVLRMVDLESSKHVDQYIANSEEVAERIKRFYKKDAVVVYPPVLSSRTNVRDLRNEISRSARNDKKEYYLAGGRLARPKHFELIIQAANELHLPLKIFGKGFAGYGEELKSLARSTVEFAGEVSDSEKLKLMSHAKAFFMASEDEDFGIVPVEAMGVGTPVIAYKSGGLKETILDGKTGVFFEELTVESLKKAIDKFQRVRIKPEDCIKQAQKFSKEHFEKGIQAVISSTVERSQE